jgi:hypothetical protein
VNQLDMLQRIVDHANAWGLDDDGLARVSFTGTAPTIRLKDHEVDLFHRWAQHLGMPLIAVAACGTALVVDGQLMCGHRVHVTVRVDSSAVRAAGVHGVLTLGHVTQIAHAGTRVVA